MAFDDYDARVAYDSEVDWESSEPELLSYCPRCSGPLVPRTNRLTGVQFMGCAQFPACRGTLPLSNYVAPNTFSDTFQARKARLKHAKRLERAFRIQREGF